MKKISFLTVLVLVGLFFVGCGKSAQERHRLSKLERARLDSLDKASLKVGVMPTLDCLPVFIAKEKRLFDTLGVDVHLRRYMAQMDCDTALARGRVEGSITDLVRAGRLQKKGTPLSYPIATGTYWQIISNKKARISELKQLSDKMIAMTRHSATDYLADIAIDSVKPQFDVYRVQINDVSIRLKMLLNNEMDAMLLTEPQATVARMAGNKVLMDSRDKNVQLGVFAFRDKAVKDAHRKKQLQLFLKAYDMAVDSINKKGFMPYADIIKKYCGVEKNVIGKLPRQKYQHATTPRERDLKIAQARNK